jgi:hypothetical protein
VWRAEYEHYSFSFVCRKMQCPELSVRVWTESSFVQSRESAVCRSGSSSSVKSVKALSGPKGLGPHQCAPWYGGRLQSRCTNASRKTLRESERVLGGEWTDGCRVLALLKVVVECVGRSAHRRPMGPMTKWDAKLISMARIGSRAAAGACTSKVYITECRITVVWHLANRQIVSCCLSNKLIYAKGISSRAV